MMNKGWGASTRVACLQSLIAILMIALPSSARAGRNANGAMLVHTDNSVIYTFTADYCTSVLPSDCADLNANGTDDIDFAGVVWLVAAFRPEASPGVTTLQFGIEHNLPTGQGYIPGHGPCGLAPLELEDAGWPETGFGNLVAYGVPVYSHIFQFYWFAVYVDPGGGNYFGTRTYPTTDEAVFVDDGNPPVLDLAYNFGTVRWDGTGANACPSQQLTGACCFPDCRCEMKTLEQCIQAGGRWLGLNTTCYPSMCDCPPSACCFPDGHCEFRTQAECEAYGGTFQGLDTSCDPNPCLWPAACCFCDGTCQMLLEADCLARDGMPFGPESECETVQCAPPPGEGACCLGQECLILNGWCCRVQNGEYKGDGTVCDPNPCEQTPVQPSTWGHIKAIYR